MFLLLSKALNRPVCLNNVMHTHTVLLTEALTICVTGINDRDKFKGNIQMNNVVKRNNDYSKTIMSK